MSAANLISVNSPGFLRALAQAIRPKTLSAAIVPVLVGTALVKAYHFDVRPWISIVALLSALMIQIGTNFVNDALDFVKGADGDSRLGPARATHQGWLTKKQMMRAAYACLAGAFLLGVPLVVEGGWPLVVIGLTSLAMAYAYTGGPFPLAYVGLGDVFVILFFGLVAVGGVFFLQVKAYGIPALVAGLQIGLLATVLIAINNLRDLDQDRLVNKKTLAVRLGPRLGRWEVVVLVASTYSLQFYWWHLGFKFAFALPWLVLPLAMMLAWTVVTTPASRAYNPLLARAAFVHMLFGVLLSIGLILQ